MLRQRRSKLAKIVAGGAVGLLAWRATRPKRSLAGQVAAITGGSRGLGLLLARELASQGCRIAICARDETELERAVEIVSASGAEVLATRCDVSEQDQVDAWIRAIHERFGRVDILINNAGIIQVGPIEAMRAADFEQVMGINFFGGVYATLAVLPEMQARRSGRIVNITSIGGKVAIPHLIPYDAAKFAMVGFSQGLRAELAKDGISVTTVVPGLMRTGSPPQALFKGKKSLEYTWFSLGSATPLTTVSAERAARRIVEAARRGEAEITLTWQAKLLQGAHELAPTMVADALSWVNRALPEHDGSSDTVRGMDLATALSPSPLTAMMNRAAIANNEYGGAAAPSAEHARKVGLTADRKGNGPDGN